MIDTVVITDRDGGAVLLSGDHAETRHATRPLPDGDMIINLPRLLQAAERTCAGAEPATLVIPSTDQLAEHVGEWTITGVGRERDNGWYQATRKSGRKSLSPRRIHLCVLDRLSSSNLLFQAGWDPQRITGALRVYRDLLEVPWYATAGVSGLALLRDLGERRPPYPRWVLPETYQQLAEQLDLPGSVDLQWRPDDAPRQRPAGHRWDIRSQYLASAQAARLATGIPTHSAGPTPYDPGRCGRWRVRIGDRANLPHFHSYGPPLWDPRAECDDGTVWLTTPMVDECLRWGCKIDVRDSVTAPGARHLHRWAETLRDAVYTMIGESLPPEIQQAIKSTYTEAIGLINRPGRRVFRPDWHDTIVDLARVLQYHKLARVYAHTGAWPIRIDHDSVWYEPELVDVWQKIDKPNGTKTIADLLGEGGFIGNFRYEGYEEGQQA